MVPPVMMAVTMPVMVPAVRADVGRLAFLRSLLRAGTTGSVRRRPAGKRRSADSHRDKEILHVITPVECRVTTDEHQTRSG
jgi:hypothetical protein